LREKEAAAVSKQVCFDWITTSNQEHLQGGSCMNVLYQRLKTKASGTRNRGVRMKVELILLGLKLGNVTEACARRGYSRKYYYKWLGRWRRAQWDLRALEEKSRRPRHSPGQTKPDIEKKIHWLHRRQFGARMIQAMLRRSGVKLAQSTICHILNRRLRGKKKRRALFNPHRRRYELVIPGQRIQLDVKYVPEFVDGRRAYNFVAVDECSRWRFAWAYHSLHHECTYDFLDKLAQHCPFPIKTIQTDNGFEFTFHLHPNRSDAAADHLMDQWCEEHNVHHRLIPVGAKELNGKVERSHRIDEQYFYWQAPTDSLEHFNAKQTLWLEFYNRHRLHGGLGYITPWEKIYERLGALPEQSVANEYESPEEFKLRFLEESPKKIQEQQRRQPLRLRNSGNREYCAMQNKLAA
jgi:transposase InsO family protein